MEAVGRRLAGASRELPPLVIVHGDLKPAHVLRDWAGQIAAVLDFEGSRVSDPALDFGRLRHNWDERFMQQALAACSGTIDARLEIRARCYQQLDSLESLDLALRRARHRSSGAAQSGRARRGRHPRNATRAR